MDHGALLFTSVFLALVALLARRIERSHITVPIVCLAGGYVIAQLTGTIRAGSSGLEGALETLAEVTLSVVLFVDASRLNLANLLRGERWSLRMLGFGLPLAILMGTFAVLAFLPELGIMQAALFAALLAPTDAALGQTVFENSRIPAKLRTALTIESGLNDGIALPAIIFFACAVVAFQHNLQQDNWFLFAVEQIGFGLIVGAALGAMGGWASHTSVERGWTHTDSTAIFALLLVGVTYLLADLIGGNGFVAVFIAGAFFGRQSRECAARARQFLNTDGALLMMVSFFYIGAVMLPPGLSALTWPVVLVVLVSLFLVRPIAIFISMIGTNTSSRDRLFLGWFGPRGLATALFTLILLHEFAEGLASETLLATAAFAVATSAILHGVSAAYAARLWDENE